MKQWKRGVAVFLVLLLIAGLMACGEKPEERRSMSGGISAQEKPAEDAPAPEAPPEPVDPPKPTEPADLTGQWKQVNAVDEDDYQGAVINEDTIEIYWVSNNGDTRSLYWSGTFTAPDTPEEPYTWDSQKNAERTEHAIMSSQDDSKTFTYQDGQISYSSSIMGTTTTVRLEKEEWAPGLEIEAEETRQAEDDAQHTPVVVGGIEFLIPAYFKKNMRESSEKTLDFRTLDDNGDLVILAIEESVRTPEEYADYVRDFGNFVEKEDDNFVFTLNEDIVLAGFAGKQASIYSLNDQTHRHLAFAYNAAENKLITCFMAMYNDESNYAEEFDHLIETATIAGESPATVPASAPVNGIRPEFKELLDSYEAFFDSYVEFMQKYKESGNSTAMLGDYMDFMNQYLDMTEKLEALGEEEMSDEEALYYSEVSLRISQKLLKAAQ